MDGMFSWPHNGSSDVQVFGGNYPSAAGAVDGPSEIWRKRPGASMVAIFALGGGGGGGAGTVGAVSSAGGGGGGGGAAQVYVELPAMLVPDILYVNVGIGGASETNGGRSTVMLVPGAYSAQNVLLVEARGGLAGGHNAVGGSGGGGGPVSSISNNPFAPGVFVPYVGQAGNSAPGPGSPSNFTLPVTGLRAMGGCPGAGLNGSGVAGSVGGTYANPDSRLFASPPGGTAGTSTTTPGGAGSNGFQLLKLGYWYGGTGGGSSHGSATGAGLVGGKGGDGGVGSGGGGGGGALTGSVQGLGGRGGDGIVVIVQW